MFHVGASFISLAPTFFKSQSAFILLLLLSKSNPLGWASVWFWHNLQPLHLFCSYHSKKCDLFRRVAFSFGFRSRWSLHPSVIEMLGRSEFALRQGFACGKTLVRRKGAAGQKAGWMLLKKNCKRPERIWIVTPCQLVASVISLAMSFFLPGQSSSRAHSAASRFQSATACAGLRFGAAARQFCFIREKISILTALSKSEQTLYRLLRRLFMPVAKETSFVRSPMPTVSKVRGAHSSPYHPAIILAGNTV